MKNPVRNYLFLFLCFGFQTAFAQQFEVADTLPERRFLFESSLGIGGVNNQITRPTFSFRAGHDNFFLTARFIRSDKGTNYIFQNSWLAGYRFHIGKRFNTTLSAGAGDIAFVWNYSGYREDILHETVGLTFDAEVQWKLDKSKTSSWYLFANYYTTFNDYKNLNGFVAGISYSPRRYNKNFFVEQRKRSRERIIHNEEVYEKRRKLREQKKAEKEAHNNKLHWEISAFVGKGDHPVTGGFQSYFEVRRIILGASLIGSYPTMTDARIPIPNAPPQYFEKRYYRNKQNQSTIFAGYRIAESRWAAISIFAGPTFRKDINAESPEGMLYSKMFQTKSIILSTGLLVQCEQSYTFRNRNFGFAISEYADFYKGYSSMGVQFAMRVGILR